METNNEVIDPQTVLIEFAESFENALGTEQAAYAMQQLTELARNKPVLVGRIFNPELVAEISGVGESSQLEIILDPAKFRALQKLISSYQHKKPTFMELPSIIEEVSLIFKKK